MIYDRDPYRRENYYFQNKRRNFVVGECGGGGGDDIMCVFRSLDARMGYSCVLCLKKVMLAVVGVYLMELQWAHTYAWNISPFVARTATHLGTILVFWINYYLGAVGSGFSDYPLGLCDLCLRCMSITQEIENRICRSQSLLVALGWANS